MTFSKALGELSSIKASISAGVGGSPVRSKVARRMSVVLFAAGAGLRPFSSNFAKTKRSRGDFAQALFLTFGIAGIVGGTNAQNCCLPLFTTFAGQGPPALPHEEIAAISCALSLPAGGILVEPLYSTAAATFFAIAAEIGLSSRSPAICSFSP